MRLLGIVTVGLCVVLTRGQIETWRSPVTLWGHAVTVAPENARAALNYGVALEQSGDRQGALLWLIRAGELSDSHPRRAEILALVRDRLLWMEAFGEPVCSRPAAQPYCS